jgi:hypothetical protein
MIFGIVLLVVIYLLWVLLAEGLLWKLILFFAGWLGLYTLLLTQPWAVATAIIIVGHAFSWAQVLPSIVCFLALLTTRN